VKNWLESPFTAPPTVFRREKLQASEPQARPVSLIR
jgi:hypothetical protein